MDDVCYASQLDGLIHKYTCQDNEWKEEAALPEIELDPTNVLLSINVANNDEHIICFRLRGFQIYRMSDHQPKYFALPSGVRNISVKSLEAVARLVFTKFNQYAVAGIRRSLYVWSVSDGTLLKTIDAHYGRIVEMLPLVVDEINAVATSSLDRTVKVWNIKNIFEAVYVIDRMELPIDSVSFASERPIVATVTRSCVGIWDMQTAKLWTILADSAIGAIVTHAVITANGNFLISIESEKLLLWDLRTLVVLNRRSQPAVKHIQLVPKNNLVVIVSAVDADKKSDMTTTSDNHVIYSVCCISYPNLELEYELEFKGRKKELLREPRVTLDGHFLVLPSYEEIEEGSGVEKDVLNIYFASSGKFARRIEFVPFTDMIPCSYRGKESIIGIHCPGTGYIVDLVSEKILAKVSRWNGDCTQDGKLGLFASPRSGLEILELKHGSTVRVLLPKVSEGLVHYTTGFTENDEYVYYYHGTKRTIRLFRVEDGEMIANYRLSAEAKVITSSPDGSSLVIGGADGSLTILLVCDPKKADCLKQLKCLPSRKDTIVKKRKKSTATWKAAAQLAKFGARRDLSMEKMDEDGAPGSPGCTSS